MAAGGGNISVTMTRLDGERERFKMKFSKQTTVKAIRTRIEMELGIPPHEQLLMFRGKELVKDMMQPLATPDLQDIIAEAGEDGLQMAVFYAKRRLPGFLTQEGLEDANSRRKTGATALHRAARRCELSVMEELLAMEDFSGVNARDQAGQTALHTSAEMWIREACEILLKSERFTASGAVDNQGRTALHLAAHMGDLKVCQMILEHPKFSAEAVQALDENGCIAMTYAKDCGHTAVVDAIANNKCKPRSEIHIDAEEDDAEEAARGAERGGEAGGVSDAVAASAAPAHEDEGPGEMEREALEELRDGTSKPTPTGSR